MQVASCGPVLIGWVAVLPSRVIVSVAEMSRGSHTATNPLS